VPVIRAEHGLLPRRMGDGGQTSLRQEPQPIFAKSPEPVLSQGVSHPQPAPLRLVVYRAGPISLPEICRKLIGRVGRAPRRAFMVRGGTPCAKCVRVAACEVDSGRGGPRLIGWEVGEMVVVELLRLLPFVPLIIIATLAIDRFVSGRFLAALLARRRPNTRSSAPPGLRWFESFSRWNHGLDPVRPDERVRRQRAHRQTVSLLRARRSLRARIAGRRQSPARARRAQGHAPRYRRISRRVVGAAASTSDGSSGSDPDPPWPARLTAARAFLKPQADIATEARALGGAGRSMSAPNANGKPPRFLSLAEVAKH
jgi:hypothetical protein